MQDVRTVQTVVYKRVERVTVILPGKLRHRTRDTLCVFIMKICWYNCQNVNDNPLSDRKFNKSLCRTVFFKFQRRFVSVFKRIDSTDQWNVDYNSEPAARKRAWQISNLVLSESLSPSG